MSKIIVTTPEELRAIVNEAIAEFLPKNQLEETKSDRISLNAAIELLSENGYPVYFSPKGFFVIFGEALSGLRQNHLPS